MRSSPAGCYAWIYRSAFFPFVFSFLLDTPLLLRSLGHLLEIEEKKQSVLVR